MSLETNRIAFHRLLWWWDAAEIERAYAWLKKHKEADVVRGVLERGGLCGIRNLDDLSEAAAKATCDGLPCAHANYDPNNHHGLSRKLAYRLHREFKADPSATMVPAGGGGRRQRTRRRKKRRHRRRKRHHTRKKRHKKRRKTRRHHHKRRRKTRHHRRHRR